MTVKHGVLILLLLLIPGLVAGREYRRHDLVDRVRDSNFIALVKVVSVNNEFSYEQGMSQRYALVEVIKKIKGKVGGRVKFITSGFTPEFNPRCCKEGAEYLIFGMFGYPIFGEEDGMDKIFMREKKMYSSSADGPYGAFFVFNGDVEGWHDDGSPEKLEKAVEEIKREIVR